MFDSWFLILRSKVLMTAVVLYPDFIEKIDTSYRLNWCQFILMNMHGTILVTIIELLRFLKCIKLFKELSCKFEIDRIILTYIKKLFHVKNVCKISKSKQVLNWMYGLFRQNYRVATLSTFILTVSGIIILSLKIVGQFQHA